MISTLWLLGLSQACSSNPQVGVCVCALSVISLRLCVLCADIEPCKHHGLSHSFYCVCCVSGGLKGVARGGLVGLAMSGAYALYSNWDHIRGGSSSSSLY